LIVIEGMDRTPHSLMQKNRLPGKRIPMWLCYFATVTDERESQARSDPPGDLDDTPTPGSDRAGRSTFSVAGWAVLIVLVALHNQMNNHE
jgi:hypothetical protein